MTASQLLLATGESAPRLPRPGDAMADLPDGMMDP